MPKLAEHSAAPEMIVTVQLESSHAADPKTLCVTYGGGTVESDSMGVDR